MAKDYASATAPLQANGAPYGQKLFKQTRPAQSELYGVAHGRTTLGVTPSCLEQSILLQMRNVGAVRVPCTSHALQTFVSRKFLKDSENCTQQRERKVSLFYSSPVRAVDLQ